MGSSDYTQLKELCFKKDSTELGGGAGEEQREGDTESEAGSRLPAVSTEPDAGLELTNRGIMTCAQVRGSTD